jgi:cell division protein FtsW
VSGARARAFQEVTPAERVLVLVSAVLVAFGLVMVYSASSVTALQSYGSSWFFLQRHIVYAVLGIVALVVVARLDYHRLRPLAPVILVVSLGLLVMVMVAGVSAKGAQRWLPLFGGFTIQPSELAKLALVIYAAAMLSLRTRPARDWREVMRPVGFATLVLCGLVVLERDIGSALALALAAASVLIVSGARGGALARVFGVGLALGGIMIWAEPYRRARFLAFLDPWKHAQDQGYQLVQAALAFGQGGVTGVGLGQGVAKAGALPEAHTDMIFAVIGQELGLMGVLALLLLFSAFAWAGFSIALQARDPFGKLLAAGVTTLVVGQAAVNFGGVLGVLPFTGVPLPLVSYGGSSLISVLAGIGLVLSVAQNGRVAVRGAAEETTTARPRRTAPRRAAAPRPRAASAARRARRA